MSLQRPKLAFCVGCNQERPVIKGYITPDFRRKRRVCLFCKRPVEVETKYRNVPRQCAQGKTHQSTLEAAHCDKLHAMEAAGVIANLLAHPQQNYDISIGGVHVTTYRADFVWIDPQGGRVVADSKGRPTDVYTIKKRLMKACLGIEILELGRDW